MIHLLLSCFHFFTKTACKTILQCSNEMHTQAMTVLNLRTNYYSHYGIMLIKEHKCYNHNHNYLFSIPEIHQRGYRTCQIQQQTQYSRGELCYLAPLGSEKISAPYFKQCFFRGGYYPPGWIKHHASQSQDRNNKYFILYIEFCINNKI